MAGALVLNATYEPLSVVSDRRAVVLVLHGKAVAVEHRDLVWVAERTRIRVPSVVRLVRYVKVPYRRNVPLTRRAVLGRDEHRCQYCAAPADSIDHVVPRSRGGSHTWDNVVACCRRCNVRKGNRLPAEAGLTLLKTPQAPLAHGWVYASTGYVVDPSWQPYLMAG
ncbi:MAG: HNH endonuclease [Acidimicrobiia bacterium]|nr:MAG: HNH endonuclease [Acidimicrobiia bacterium]